jgi:glycosyltransferase involved in cell wall biosynthesis
VSRHSVRDMIEVILPCLNEAAALPWVLSRLPDGYRALVVDNGSTDGSADVARRYGARVIREGRRGFGAACHAGLLAAAADVVCFMDADASLDPAELPTVVAALARADLVLGRRRPSTRRAWPSHARIGNVLVSRRFGLHDIGPMRAVSRTRLLDLGLTDRRSGYPLEMVARAAGDGWRLTEVDVAYHPRTGRSKVTGTVRGTLQAVRDMHRVLTATTAASTAVTVATTANATTATATATRTGAP